MTVPQEAIDAANAWATAHGHKDIAVCGATPLAAFAAGMAAERERIRQLAIQHNANAQIPADNIAGYRWVMFASLLTEGDTTGV